MAYGVTMQFPFEALNNGVIVVRRPLGGCTTQERQSARVTPTFNPLVAACRHAVHGNAWESVIWLTLFLSALALSAISFAL